MDKIHDTSEQRQAGSHTPGPWRVTAAIYHDDEITVQAGESVVATAWPFGEDEVGDGVQAANARLIAAAPDLLNSLQVTLRMLEAAYRDLGMWTNDNPRVKAARAAIAKATERSK